MSRAISAFSSKRITEKGLQGIMDHLRASKVNYGWALSRRDRHVFVELATEDLDEAPDDLVVAVGRELGAPPESWILFMFDDSQEDRFEYEMARAAMIAMAELWPIVFHDHAGTTERVYPPGTR